MKREDWNIDVDYSKNIIYKIQHKTDKSFPPYIGSTCKGENKRWEKHINRYNTGRYTSKNKLFTTFDEHGIQNFELVKIEDWPCEDFDEARQRETYWCKQYVETLNSLLPSITEEEYKQKQRDLHIKTVICDECKLEYVKYRKKDHEKSEDHKHLSNIKKTIEENKYDDFGDCKYLDDGKILCKCKMKFPNRIAFEHHFIGDHHIKLMETIIKFQKNHDKEKHKNDLVKISIELNDEMICECGIKIKTKDHTHHLNLQIHPEFMQSRARIELEMDDKKIEIKEDYIMCKECYGLYHKKKPGRHYNNQKHKDGTKAAITIKNLLKKRKLLGNQHLKLSELNGDLVKIDILPIF